MRTPWIKRRSFYSFLLILVLTVHTIFLLLQIQFKEISEVPERKPLVVKIEDQLLKNKRQIVTSEDSDVREKKDNAYLSDKDRSFDRQTRAAKVAPFKTGESSAGAKKSGAKKVSLSDLGSQVGEDPFKEAAKEYTKKKNGHGDNRMAQEESSNNDFLNDVPVGDATNLNTVEYKYYGFYHRIKLKLEQFWGRTLYDKAEQMAESGRRLPSSEEMMTSLQVTLNDKGEVVSVKIIGTSGIKELDDAAIESFNEAGPFPNPPKGMIRNGRVTLEWGFVVKS